MTARGFEHETKHFGLRHGSGEGVRQAPRERKGGAQLFSAFGAYEVSCFSFCSTSCSRLQIGWRGHAVCPSGRWSRGVNVRLKQCPSVGGSSSQSTRETRSYKYIERVSTRMCLLLRYRPRCGLGSVRCGSLLDRIVARSWRHLRGTGNLCVT